MKNFRQWLTVDDLGGKYAVVRREQWERSGTAALASIVRNAIMADGPFEDRADAERARDLIEERSRA